MKFRTAFLLVIFCFTSFLIQTKAVAAEITRDLAVSINHIFTPDGFDSNSEAFVIISGLFPNGCYRWKGVEKNDLSQFEHEFISMATVTQGLCIQVIIPFTIDVQLGKLQTGTHTLRFLSNDGTYLEKSLIVE